MLEPIEILVSSPESVKVLLAKRAEMSLVSRLEFNSSKALSALSSKSRSGRAPSS